MHFIRGRYNAKDSNLESLHHVANGRIEALEFEITEATKIVDKPLSSLKLKSDILIAAIIRHGKAIYPTGEDKLQCNDKIVVITLKQNITQLSDLIAR